MSVIANEGIKEIINEANRLLKDISEEQLEELRQLDEVLKEVLPKKKDWIIEKLDDNVYELSGQIVDNVMNKYVFIGEEGIIQFLQVMRNLGMEQKLENAGVEKGDTIVIEGYEFEYV